MPELHEVIEVLARAAATSPGWSTADSDLIVEWLEDNRPLERKVPVSKTGGKS